MRTSLILVSGLFGATLLLTGVGWWAGRREAQEAPVIARYAIRGGPESCGAPPLRLVVMGDLHVSEQTTPPAAIARAVGEANALRPDLVLLVGDYLGSGWPHDPATVGRAVAPLAGLRARLGTAAILGNNDWVDGPETITAALRARGVHVLHNDAWVTPEVAVLGVEEITSNRANPRLTLERYETALRHDRLAPPPWTFWLAHKPVMIERLPTTGTMLFAGHTHGGQILPGLSVPLGRKIVDGLRAIGFVAGWPAERYVRGPYRDGAKRVLVTSGVGVSGLPLRLAVPPEIAFVSVGGCHV